MKELEIKKASIKDVNIILNFIKELAEFENLSHEVSATEQTLANSLFAEQTNAEAIIGYFEKKPVAFAIFFHNYSTFLGKKGLYLEDLFVLPNFRGHGFGKSILKYLAKLAVERDCGRLEWSVLDWNEKAIKFYKSIGAELKEEWILNRISGNTLKALADI
jgi:GNAT superfamily N-acetyltransferase